MRDGVKYLAEVVVAQLGMTDHDGAEFAVVAVDGLSGCYTARLADVVEIDGFPRRGMQLLANIGEHFVVFIVAAHDRAGIGW